MGLRESKIYIDHTVEAREKVFMVSIDKNGFADSTTKPIASEDESSRKPFMSDKKGIITTVNGQSCQCCMMSNDDSTQVCSGDDRNASKIEVAAVHSWNTNCGGTNTSSKQETSVAEGANCSPYDFVFIVSKL